MALPTKFRESVLTGCTGSLVVTIDTKERCLLLYPLPEWEHVQERLEGLSNIRSSARLLQRMLIGHATDVELDANGRVLVPQMLRDYADLSKKLVVLGQGNKIEIWSDQHWHERMEMWLAEGLETSFDDLGDLEDLSV